MENLWIACENAKDLYTKNVVYPQVSALHDRRSPRHLTNARESVILGLGGDMRFAAFNSQDLIREMGLAASGFQARFRKRGGRDARGLWSSGAYSNPAKVPFRRDGPFAEQSISLVGAGLLREAADFQISFG